MRANLAEGNSNNVAGAPVEGVEVEVAAHLGGIQDAVGVLGDVAAGLAGGGGAALAVQHIHLTLVALTGLGGGLVKSEYLAALRQEAGGHGAAIVHLGRAAAYLIILSAVVEQKVALLDAGAGAGGDEAICLRCSGRDRLHCLSLPARNSPIRQS